ncbi:MAG TPA: RNase H family protein [Longimicrobium sp.]|nr:RNase H family protein [Longimicrobium sp.]
MSEPSPEQPLVFVYADESCLGNQFKGRARPGGAAGVLEFWHETKGWVRRDYWLAEPDTTNNRMAIRSAILPLAALKGASRVVFTSDSRYLVDGMTQWVHGWAARGWKRKDGEIENLELWRELVRTAARHAVQWRWVKGHAGHPQNEYANHLATTAAAKQTQSGGLIDSRFDEWIAAEQEKDRYLDFFAMPPAAADFKASRRPPAR